MTSQIVTTNAEVPELPKVRVLICAPHLGAMSEVFIYRQIIHMRRVSPVLCVDSHINRRLYPQPAPLRQWMPVGQGVLQRALYKGVRMIGLGDWRTGGSIWKHWVARICRKFDINVILAHYGDRALDVLDVSRDLKIPLIAHFHGVDASKRILDPRYLSRLQNLWDSVHSVVAVSSYMRWSLITAGCPSQKVKIINYGIDGDVIRPCLNKADSFTFLHVGRLVEKKGILYTIRAFAALGADVDCRLVVVGTGPQREEAEALANELNITERVTFLGASSSMEVAEQLSRAHVFVLHSVTASDGDEEGLPVALLEAQAAELPIVATRHAGIPEEVIDGTTGILVGERDVEAMTRAMRGLYSNVKRRIEMGRRARIHVMRNFPAHEKATELEQQLQLAASEARRE